LGEVARQEEARRKTVKSPGKVYTNDSLRPDTSSPATASAPADQPVASSGAATGAGTSTGDAPAPDPKKDETQWRDRIKGAREALERARVVAAALESRINALNADFVNRDDPAQRNVIASDRQRAMVEMERLKKEIEQHTKAITGIQEEARRANVPAGWVR